MANSPCVAPGRGRKAVLDEIASIDTGLHRHPEQSMHEYRTARSPIPATEI